MPGKPFRFKLPIKNTGSAPVISVVQNDTNEFIIQLLDNGKPFDISRATLATYTALKPDGTVVKDKTAKITNTADGILILTPDLQCVVMTGTVEMTVEIYEGAARMTSAIFYLEVTKDLSAGADPSSEQALPILERLVEDVSALEVQIKNAEAFRVTAEDGRVLAETSRVKQETTRQAQESIRQRNELIRQNSIADIENRWHTLTAEQQQDAEVIDARRGKTSLGEKIDDIDSQLTEMAISVKQFGAKGDGVTDDSNAFIACFNGGNKNILIPHGNYLITKSIPVYSNTNIVCYGTIIDRYVIGENINAPIGLFNAEQQNNIKFTNLNIKGQGTGQNIAFKETLNFDECQNIDIIGGKFTNISSIWVIRFNMCNITLVDNIYINHYSYGGVGNLGGGDNFKIINSNILNLEPYITNKGNTYPIMLNGYEIEIPPDTKMGRNLQAINNYIYNEQPYWENIDAHGGINIVVADNICDNCYDGIAIFSTPSSNFYSENVVIKGNVVNGSLTGNIRAGVAAHGITADAKGLIVSDNIIKNAGHLSATNGAGIYSRFTENGKIINNVIINSKQMGIYVGLSKNLLIKNNDINGVNDLNNESFGIYIASTGTEYYDNVIIENNQIANTKYFYQGPNNQIDTNRKAYLAFNNNVYIGDGQYIRATYFKPDYCNSNEIQYVKMGRLRDIIYNLNPQKGQPLGWICTLPTTVTENAVWTPFFTIPL